MMKELKIKTFPIQEELDFSHQKTFQSQKQLLQRSPKIEKYLANVQKQNKHNENLNQLNQSPQNSSKFQYSRLDPHDNQKTQKLKSGYMTERVSQIEKQMQFTNRPQFIFDKNSQLVQTVFPKKKKAKFERRPTSALQSRKGEKYQEVSYSITRLQNPLEKLHKKQINYHLPKCQVGFDNIINAVSQYLEEGSDDKILQRIHQQNSERDLQMSSNEKLAEILNQDIQKNQLQEQSQASKDGNNISQLNIQQEKRPKTQINKKAFKGMTSPSPQLMRLNLMSQAEARVTLQKYKNMPDLNLSQNLMIKSVNSARSKEEENKIENINADILNDLEKRLSPNRRGKRSNLQNPSNFLKSYSSQFRTSYQPVIIKDGDFLQIQKESMQSLTYRKGFKGSLLKLQKNQNKSDESESPTHKKEEEEDQILIISPKNNIHGQQFNQPSGINSSIFESLNNQSIHQYKPKVRMHILQKVDTEPNLKKILKEKNKQDDLIFNPLELKQQIMPVRLFDADNIKLTNKNRDLLHTQLPSFNHQSNFTSRNTQSQQNLPPFTKMFSASFNFMQFRNQRLQQFKRDELEKNTLKAISSLEK